VTSWKGYDVKQKLIVEVPGAGEREAQPALAVLRAAAGEDYDVEVRVRPPEAKVELTDTIFTFVHPNEVGPLLAALASGPELHGLRDRLMGHVHELTDETACKYRDAAFERSRDGDLEVDSNALVSVSGENGAYVQAWLWVTDEDAGVTRGPEDA